MLDTNCSGSLPGIYKHAQFTFYSQIPGNGIFKLHFMASTQHSSCEICNTLKLKKMACMWRKLAGGSEKKPPPDVPQGHLAVTVGEASRRFVIQAEYLNHPAFRQLLDQAYEEYGHSKNGPLAIPCDEFCFQDIIHSLRNGSSRGKFSCYVAEEKIGLSLWRDSEPLLQDHARR